jgi:hypothetical protein
LRLNCFKTKGELEEFIYHDNHITTKRIQVKSEIDLKKKELFLFELMLTLTQVLFILSNQKI